MGVKIIKYITIYNNDTATGTGTTYTGNSAVDGCGNCPPEDGVSAQITSDNPNGCLTIEFVSNGSNQKPGWEAVISCWEPCQEISNPSITTTPALTDLQLTVDVDEVVQFQGSADFAVSSASAVYTWDFGDGTTVIGQNPEYTYTTTGIFDVTLTVSDSSCTDESTTIIAAPIQVIVGSSAPGFAYVDAGEDVLLGCDNSTQLSASFLEIGETNTYEITEIPFLPPFPFQGLANSVNTNIDDSWDDPQDLPFTNPFCFFGNPEEEFQVGSNGLIRFDVDPFDTSNAWNLQNNPLPNNSNPALGEGNVFTPVHDIDPAASTGEEIAWEIIGEYPNRVLAVSYFNVEMYGCSSAIATHMAVLYETTNIIDIYIENAPFCSSFNNNKAVGIQNHDGTIAYVPPVEILTKMEGGLHKKKHGDLLLVETQLHYLNGLRVT